MRTMTRTSIFSLFGALVVQTASLGVMAANTKKKDDFAYVAEQFADLRVLRYNIPGFEGLSLKQKTLALYLSRAALAGRDIYWDQNYRHNLTLRRVFEQIVTNFNGDVGSDIFKKFLTYAKRVWFSN